MKLSVTPTGIVRYVYTESMDLEDLGVSMIRRASNVEPSDDGWYAYIADGGPVLGPFVKRSQAIKAEIGWLEQHAV